MFNLNKSNLMTEIYNIDIPDDITVIDIPIYWSGYNKVDKKLDIHKTH